MRSPNTEILKICESSPYLHKNHIYEVSPSDLKINNYDFSKRVLFNFIKFIPVAWEFISYKNRSINFIIAAHY